MEGSLARAKYSFQSSSPDELSVPEGSIITVTQYINNHWLEAEYKGKRGYFPIIYAERITNDSQLHTEQNAIFSVPCLNGEELPESVISDDFHHQDYSSGKQVSHSSSENVVEAAFGFDARNDNELTFPSGALLEVTKDVDDDWLEGSFNGRTGLFPKSYVKSSKRPCARALYPFVGESMGELTFREGDCIFLHKRLNSQWMEGEIDGNVGIFPSSFVIVEVELPPDKDEFLNGDFSPKNASPKCGSHINTATAKIQWKVGMKGRALFRFSALYSGDLELNEGDIVTVLCVDGDNWIEGQLANGISGSCPAAYLEPVINKSNSPENHWNFKTRKFTSWEDFSGSPHVMSNSVNTSEMSKSSSRVSFSQQGYDIFDPLTTAEYSDRPLLDSSFTQDLTPILMPWNKSTQESKEVGKTEFLVKQPAPKSRTLERYSVTYLGNMEGKNLSIKHDKTSSSPSYSAESLTWGTTPLRSSYASNLKAASAYNGLSGQSSVIDQGPSLEPYHQGSVGTWPSKRSGIHAGCTSSVQGNFVDDLLSGNCTSLPPPLIPGLQGAIDDDNIDSSASEDSPITPRRPAPPPPKRKDSGNAVRSRTLPARRSKDTGQGHFNWDALPSGREDMKTTVNPTASPKGSPKMGVAGVARQRPQSKPQSLVNKDVDTDVYVEKSPRRPRHSSSLEQIRQSPSQSTVAAVIDSDAHGAEWAGNKENSVDEVDGPRLASLQKRIKETEQNLKKEMNVHTGFKSIAQLVMMDPVKQREMEVKVSQSQQKINEWHEELQLLQDEKVFMIESHRKKMLRNKIAALEADLQKQARSQRSLEMLLGVVEENRKKEVMENLGVCAKLVEKIKTELAGLEASLQCLTEKPAVSNQKHMAEQRQRVVNELINTEKDYCNDLDLCVKYFLHELQMIQVKDLDCEALFGNIESVLGTSRKLLKGLQNAVQTKEGKDQELGKCFVDLSEEIKDVYAVYCRNHDDAISLMEKYEEMPEIQDEILKCLEKIREHTRCWDLSSFLIKPVQRVLKYPLLLNELLKYTPEIHRDKYNLLQAITVMTDVANAINEFKRRKDLVVKYKKVEESGLTNKIQKLSWHSVVKKGTRINQKLTQLTGLVAQTVDEKFIEEEKKFRGVEKTVKALWKNVSTYLEEFEETMEFRQALGDNINDFYQDAATCSEVSTYYRTHKTIGETILSRFIDSVQLQVLSPLNSLLNLFQGPQRLIQKRNDKCLDYDSWSNKIDKIKDREKLKVAKEELGFAKKNYEALNTQLLEEIPGFTEKCMSLVVDCLKNFAMAQNRLYYEIQQEYEQLLQLPVVQTVEGDIIEHHSKRSLQVMEQFSDLSFIPLSFVAKDSSRRKRRSLKTPTQPSRDQDTTEDYGDNKPSLVDFRGDEFEERMLRKQRQAPPPPSTILQPTPAPRRLSSAARPGNSHAGSSDMVEVIPGREKLHMVEFSFEAQSTGELSVTEGNLVSVLRYSDTSGNPEWWLIQCNGATGYVPQSYLSPLEDAADSSEGGASITDNAFEDDSVISNETSQMVATETDPGEECSVALTRETNPKSSYYAEFAFEASSVAELNLEEGQAVVVLQKQDLTGNEEWWLVEADGRKGYVPSSYLTPVED